MGSNHHGWWINISEDDGSRERFSSDLDYRESWSGQGVANRQAKIRAEWRAHGSDLVASGEWDASVRVCRCGTEILLRPTGEL